MSIAIEDFSTASKIFFNLQKTGELKEKRNKELFFAYLNNAGVREALACISEASKSRIITMPDGLYLLPDMDNDILGFDYRKEPLLGGTLKEYYLSYLIMTIIFAEFTNEYCPTSYLVVTDIIDLVSESLNRSSARSDIKVLEDKHAFNILTIKGLWDSKDLWKEDEEKDRKNQNSKNGKKIKSKDYKIGYIRRVISFLQKEELVSFVEGETKIVATDRFKNIMNGYFLDEDRKNTIETVFLGKGGDINGISE